MSAIVLPLLAPERIAGMKTVKMLFTGAAMLFATYLVWHGYKRSDIGEAVSGLVLLASGTLTLRYFADTRRR